ncbi:hypothetical protein SRM1_02887 [Pseudomonas fluorescens]|nr:hypothetical protein SRM1_02887 [Pseudomonas fluorescens]
MTVGLRGNHLSLTSGGKSVTEILLGRFLSGF